MQFILEAVLDTREERNRHARDEVCRMQSKGFKVVRSIRNPICRIYPLRPEYAKIGRSIDG